MFWRAQATHWWVTRGLSRVLAAVVLLAGLATSAMLMTEAAQAHAINSKSSNLVSIGQKSERASVVVSAASAPTVVIDVLLDHKQCCDGNHLQGGDCVSACCFAFSAAMNGANAGLAFSSASIRHGLLRQDGLFAVSPPPEFRPPRILA